MIESCTNMKIIWHRGCKPERTGDHSGAAVIVGGGLTGGVGAKLAGGNFWEGVSQGLITSGLNHAAHSGLLGEGFAVALVTQRLRHIISPDAIHVAAGVEVGVVPLIEVKLGKVILLRGKLAGTVENLWEFAIGGGLDMGVSGEVTRLYYNGNAADMRVSTFEGQRIQGILGYSIGLEVSQSVSYSSLENNNFVLGVGNGVGFGLGLPTPFGLFSGNITYGYSFVPKF